MKFLSDKWFYFLIILLLGLLIRLWHLDIPLLEFYPTRQVQTAEIARNFFRDRSSILEPKVGYLGQEKVPFSVEFPIFNYVVSRLYLLSGGVRETIGRLLSIVGWLISSVLLFLLISKIANPFVSLSAIFFYSFSPLSVLISRSFQPDQWMLTFSVASIYLLLLSKSKSGRKNLLFLFSAIFASMSILMKLPSVLFTVIPALFILYKGPKKRLESLIFLSIALFPSLMWYFYASKSSEASGLAESFTIANWFGLEVFLNPKYWSNLFGFEMNLVLLPVGMVLFLLGIMTKLKNNQRFLYSWLASVILYFLIFNKHSMTHEYYHLPFLPVAVIFIGLACGKLLAKRLYSLVLVAFLVLALMFAVVKNRAYMPIDRFNHVLETASVIRELTSLDDLIVGQMDAGPSLMYYADRRGWEFQINTPRIEMNRAFFAINDKRFDDPIYTLESFKRQGATIFASAYKTQLAQNKQFENYLYNSYPILAQSDYYVIFDLNHSR